MTTLVNNIIVGKLWIDNVMQLIEMLINRSLVRSDLGRRDGDYQSYDERYLQIEIFSLQLFFERCASKGHRSGDR